MNATILFYSCLGKATFIQGELISVTELAFNPMNGSNTSSFEIEFNTVNGLQKIETKLDFYILNRFQNIISLDEWSAFSSSDLDALVNQVASHQVLFKKSWWEYSNRLGKNLVSLQPKPPKTPVPNQIIGNLIRAKLEERV